MIHLPTHLLVGPTWEPQGWMPSMTHRYQLHEHKGVGKEKNQWLQVVFCNSTNHSTSMTADMANFAGKHSAINSKQEPSLPCCSQPPAASIPKPILSTFTLNSLQIREIRDQHRCEEAPSSGDPLGTPLRHQHHEQLHLQPVVMVTECWFFPSFKKDSYQFSIILPVNNNSYLKRSLRWLQLSTASPLALSAGKQPGDIICFSFWTQSIPLERWDLSWP